MTSDPDGIPVHLSKFGVPIGDHVPILEQWHRRRLTQGCRPLRYARLANSDGFEFNQGVFNSGEIIKVGPTYNRDDLNAINHRLLWTLDVLQALILDLKSRKVLGDEWNRNRALNAVEARGGQKM